MLVTCQQMQEIEAAAFARGIHAADLMQQAGCGIAAEVSRFFPKPGSLILYLGSGNNAGDALVAARELQEKGWLIHVRLSGAANKLKPLPARHLQALPAVCQLSEPVEMETLPRPIVQLDGLLGIGATGALREDVRLLAAEMNVQRLKHRASTVAMDIPSGLNGDTGIPEEDAVIADLTVTVAYAKQGLLADTAINHVGRLALVPLPDLKPDWATPDTGSQLLTPEFLRPVLPRRDFDFHKGRAGRVGIIAGSAGYYGAAILACAGALRAGGGLVTLLVKAEAYPILASKAPPEVMVKVVKDYREALDLSFDSLGIGPGIGLTAEAEILDIIRTAPLPCIIDADAITLLARGHSAILESPAPRLLTPHPGEMQHLMPGIQHETRLTQARLAAERFKGHTLLLKGARTIIATHGQMTAYNTTGHPGMATGGMGDVLTGVCTALSAQGIPLPQAAGMAAWSSGRAAEMAALTLGQNAVLPSDVAAHLGAAFLELEE